MRSGHIAAEPKQTQHSTKVFATALMPGGEQQPWGNSVAALLTQESRQFLTPAQATAACDQYPLTPTALLNSLVHSQHLMLL
jgi:hypothetical protein